MEPERRPVAVVFVDVVGFTAFSQQFGEEAAFTLMQSLMRLMESAIEEQGGVIRNFTGDGAMAVFGAPVAFEDTPLRACRAALTILQRLSAAGDDLEATFGARPQVRIGINFGPVVFGEVQDKLEGGLTALGDATNLASRLQAFAEPGTAVISEAMHRMVLGLADATPLGERQIKGRTGSEKIYRLEAIRAGASRFQVSLHRGLTAYIGRDRELDRLERIFDVVASGLQIVDIVGDAGIGKSRLLHEFREQIVKGRAVALFGACTPNGSRTPFSAFIDIARGAVRLLPGDDEKTVARKLGEGLQSLELHTQENLGLLMNMLGLEAPKGALAGLDGVLIGMRTRNLLRQIVQERARLTPLILIFEDLHWLDSASEELLANLVEVPRDLRLLILHTRRPTYVPSWAGSPRLTRLPLEPLSERETSRIAQARLGVDLLPEELGKLISSRADGNALFAEELASYLAEQGVVRRRVGGVEFDLTTVAAALPQSVQSLLASRVDLLGAADRTLMQTAAVVGRQFDPELVLAVTGITPTGETPFAAMQALDLVRRDERTGAYVFKHSLVRDALYAALLKEQRVALHRKVAEEFERRGANNLYEIAETLAYHYSAAEGVEKAFEYLAMAGHKSLNVYAIQEADRYYRQALAVFEPRQQCAPPASVVKVVVRLLETLLLKSDYRDAGELVSRFMPFLRQAGETRELVTACYYQALTMVHQRKLREAHALMEEALAVADRLGDGLARAYARGGLLQCRTRMGLDTPDEAERIKALLMQDSLRYGDNLIQNSSYFFVSWDYFYRGLLVQAREVALRLIASGRERSDPRAIGVAHWILGWFDLVGGESETAIAHADDCLRVAIAPFDRLQGAMIKAVAEILLGRAQEGLDKIDALHSDFDRLGLSYGALQGPRGLALAALGRIAEGVAVIEKAIAQSDEAGDRTAGAITRVLLAEIYIRILSSKRGAPAEVLRKNLGFLIGAKLFGARRARALLMEAASQSYLSQNGVTLARINFNLGVLSARKRKRQQARSFFERAHAGAASQGEAELLKRIGSALAEIA